MNEKLIWKLLKKHGIESEEQLDREIKNMTLLNIGIMTRGKVSKT